jgi:hypothetical protein
MAIQNIKTRDRPNEATKRHILADHPLISWISVINRTAIYHDILGRKTMFRHSSLEQSPSYSRVQICSLLKGYYLPYTVTLSAEVGRNEVVLLELPSISTEHKFVVSLL